MSALQAELERLFAGRWAISDVVTLIEERERALQTEVMAAAELADGLGRAIRALALGVRTCPK